MANKRTYLVTGAAGYLGSEVCRQLLEQNESVRAFVLPNDPAIQYIPKDVEIVEGDLRDKASLETFFHVDADTETVVLHCASIVALGMEMPKIVMDINVGGTQNIIDLCLEHKECKKLVYVGSTGSIPEAPKGSVMKEISYYDPEPVISAYGKSKAMASQLVLDAVKNQHLNACLVLPSGILGPGDNAIGQVTDGLLKQMNGEAAIGINGTFNLCDVRDLANAVILAVENGKSGESYSLANEVITYPEFANIVAKEGRCKRPLFFLPLPLASFVANILEKQAQKKGSTPALTKYMIYNLSRNNAFDSSKAKKDLGYKTRPFHETIRDEIAWLKEIGKLQGTNTVNTVSFND